MRSAFWAVIKTLYFGFVLWRVCVCVQLVWFDAKYTILNPQSAIRALTVLVLSHETKKKLISKIKKKKNSGVYIQIRKIHYIQENTRLIHKYKINIDRFLRCARGGLL